MADEPFLAEIRLMSFDFPPNGWALCNGQLLQINQNQALFALLGTTYGGDGQATFALPNLQGRVPVHVSNSIQLGQSGGEQTHTLIATEMPAHQHALNCKNGPGTLASPAAALPAVEAGDLAPHYTSNGGTTNLNANSIAIAGGGQPHENMPPYLTLNFCIATVGVFPSRS